MKIILDTLEIIKQVLPKQQYDSKQEYRLSSFCEKIDIDNQILLFNNLTKSLILLSNDEYSAVLSVKTNISFDLYDKLIEMYFLVTVHHNDILLADQLRNTARLMENPIGINQFTILPTTACNARCFYCYEAGLPTFTMSETVANDVADYIIKNHNPQKKVKIRWFGGEPLCNINAINIICDKLRCSNINFVSNIVSNSYLFDENLIQHAHDFWNLKQAQVTLDGCKDTYNKVKNYKNTHNDPFEQVTKNIELLSRNGVNVIIRINMDNHNSEELPKLVDWIAERYSDFSNISVYARPLFENIEINSVKRNEIERRKLTEKFSALQEKITHYGLDVASSIKKSIATHSCQADSKDCVLISPEGKLGRCEHHINDDFIGDIYGNSPNLRWTDYTPRVEKCSNCSAYPTCIRLKGCNNNRIECYDYEKYIRINNIRKAMIAEYKKFKQKSEM